MGIFDWFRRPPPIEDRPTLTDFLDTRAAFLSQKSVFDYARGISGPFFSQLIKEAAFVEGVDKARWTTYPVSISLVAEMAYGVLMPVRNQPVQLAAVLTECSLEAFDRYPVPAPVGSEYWTEARRELTARVEAVSLHPPKYVKDIPLPVAQRYLDAMPIHERLRGKDYELVRNQLRGTLLTMHRDFVKRANLERLVEELDLELAAERTAAAG